MIRHGFLQRLATPMMWQNWLFSTSEILCPSPLILFFSFHFSLQKQCQQILLSCLGIRDKASPEPAGCSSQSAPATLRAKGSDGNYSSERKTTSPSEANPTALAPCCNINWRSHQAERKSWKVNQINWYS